MCFFEGVCILDMVSDWYIWTHHGERMGMLQRYISYFCILVTSPRVGDASCAPRQRHSPQECCQMPAHIRCWHSVVQASRPDDGSQECCQMAFVQMALGVCLDNVHFRTPWTRLHVCIATEAVGNPWPSGNVSICFDLLIILF